MSSPLKYLNSYPATLQNQIQKMLDDKSLKSFLLRKYPKSHSFVSDKALRQYTLNIKNEYLKKSAPLSQVKYDDKIDVIKNALGLHTFISRVQGNKLKSKNEIRIASVFKKCPIEFLNMIVVHELSHFREKEHNKAFYKLCQHMLPDYHQLEFELRVYLTYLDKMGELYQ